MDALAERRRVAEREVATQIAAAQAGLEQERNRLATLMAELAVAVLVCNIDGPDSALQRRRALGARRRHGASGSAGRSSASSTGICSSTPWPASAPRRASSHVATTLYGGRLLQVRVATVDGPDGELTGFVLLLEDLTERMRASSRRDDLLREFTEATRASLGSIQAAIETVTGLPRHGARGARAVRRHRAGGVPATRPTRSRRGPRSRPPHLAADWLLSEMRGDDLLSVVARAIEREDAVTVSVRPATDALWVKVDSHALARTAVHLVGRLREQVGVERVTLAITRAGGHAQLERRGQGRHPDRRTSRPGWTSRSRAAPHRMRARSSRAMAARCGPAGRPGTARTWSCCFR